MRRVTQVVAVFLASLLPQGALAGPWGPTYSYYDGQARVEGRGETSVYAANNEYQSRSWVKATDVVTDGNTVYAYTKWYKVVTSCVTGGVQGNGFAEFQTCSSEYVEQSRQATPEARDGAGNTVERTLAEALCCYGLRVEAAACAQMGFPVPDSCTEPYYIFHRPPYNSSPGGGPGGGGGGCFAECKPPPLVPPPGGIA